MFFIFVTLVTTVMWY